MIDLRQLSEHWGASGQFPVHWALVGFGAVVILVAGLSCLQWWRGRAGASRPLLAFNTVAKQVGLNWSERLLLVRIAREARLPGPLTLMVCPATLEHHGRQFGERRPGRAQRVDAALATVQRKAFHPPATR